jgi:hypothetical protein
MVVVSDIRIAVAHRMPISCDHASRFTMTAGKLGNERHAAPGIILIFRKQTCQNSERPSGGCSSVDEPRECESCAAYNAYASTGVPTRLAFGSGPACQVLSAEVLTKR